MTIGGYFKCYMCCITALRRLAEEEEEDRKKEDKLYILTFDNFS